MAVTIINSSNQAEHVKIQGPDGKRDIATIHPGRQTLAEGWSVVDTGISIRHLRVVDGSTAATVAAVAAKQAAASQVIAAIPAPAADKAADKKE